MSYIYVIENDINEKQYVGKTMFSIEKRFQEHLRDASRKRKEHRPLYNAINKYGSEHFTIRLLQEVPDEQAAVAEQEWIKKLDTYNQGYNATLGGDGRVYLDYKQILNLYDNSLKSQGEIAKECQCSEDSVRNIVSQYRENLDWIHRYSERKEINNLGIVAKQVRCIEEDKVFLSCQQAANWLISKGLTQSKGTRNHISECANGKRKTCLKYHWEWI